MLPLIGFAKIAIYAIMAVSIIAAVGAITLPNLFHAALCFVIVLIGIAGVFITLHAEFLGVVQILVYVGAIMTMVIFAIMLTSGFSDKATRQHNKLGFPTLVGAAAFFLILLDVIFKTPWNIRPETTEAHVSAEKLGETIMITYVFPFEVIAVLLTAALIGAIVVTRKDRKES